MNRTLIVWIVVAVLAGGLGWIAEGAGPGVDAALLLDVIGQTETRGEARKPHGSDDALSRKGAVGRYQVLPASARALGYRGSNVALFAAAANRAWARAVLDDCRAAFPRGTPYRLAYCYNGGPRARAGIRESREFARQVAADYATALVWLLAAGDGLYLARDG